MNKEEFIKRRGEAAYEKHLQQMRDWYMQHREEANIQMREWARTNPEKVIAYNQEISRKGGKRYEKHLEYKTTGLQGERSCIRLKHRDKYRSIKQATPNSVLHHEWLPGTAKYRGVTLVEKIAHQNGIIKVIKVLEGEITLFTEKEVKTGVAI